MTIVISTHALREEGDKADVDLIEAQAISTHALREEGDGDGQHLHPEAGEFLPTPSARRATRF